MDLSNFTPFACGLMIMMMSTWDHASASTPSSSSSSKTSNASAAEEIGNNDDLLLQILFSLPAKSLLRFRCVSKKWNRIISSHCFAINHTRKNRHPISTSLLMLRRESLILLSLGYDHDEAGHHVPRFRAPALDYFNTTRDMTMRILSICNGLMLCNVTSPFWGYFNHVYCVSNITREKYIRLPPPGSLMEKPVLGICLAFDPSRAPHFKVLCIGQSSELYDRGCYMEIYSSETNRWKKWNGGLFNTKHLVEVFDRGVFCNGALHWLCQIDTPSYCFSLEDETMRVLPLPPMHKDLGTLKTARYMSQSGGYLQLVDVETNLFQKPPLDIFEMGKDYGVWSLNHRVSLDFIETRFPEMVGVCHAHVRLWDLMEYTGIHRFSEYTCSVLSVIHGRLGQGLDIILLIPHRIISYNTRFRTIKVLLYFEESLNLKNFRWFEVYPFTESLSWFS